MFVVSADNIISRIIPYMMRTLRIIWEEWQMPSGIYGIVWRPEENGITTAEQLIEPLEKAIADMKARPEYYEQFNSPNGWGTYKIFVPWLEKYLAACKEYPDAVVEVSR